MNSVDPAPERMDGPLIPEDRSERPLRPQELKLLCLAYLGWGAVSFCGNIPHWQSTHAPEGEIQTLMIDPWGIAGLFVAIGLWRRWAAGRTLALIFSWCWLFASGALFLKLFPPAHMTVTTGFLDGYPTALLRIIVVPLFLAQLWQIRTLNRPAIRALFYPPPQPPELPDPPRTISRPMRIAFVGLMVVCVVMGAIYFFVGEDRLTAATGSLFGTVGVLLLMGLFVSSCLLLSIDRRLALFGFGALVLGVLGGIDYSGHSARPSAVPAEKTPSVEPRSP